MHRAIPATFLALGLLLAKNVIPPATGEEQRGAADSTGLDRAAVEANITSILSRTSNSRTSSARFEGCVLVVSHATNLPVAWPGFVLQEDNRLDLSFIVTDADSVRIMTSPESGLTFAHYDWRPEVEGRLRTMNLASAEILEEGYSLYPDDVPARLEWLASEYDRRLVDKIYLNASTSWLYDNQSIVVSPMALPTFLIDPLREAEFLTLIQDYQAAFCRQVA